MNIENNLLYISLQKYYSEKSKLDILLKYLRYEKISLRIIDWFVTNYSKKHDIIYNNKDKQFNVFHSYKSQLKSYSKKYFDPFCRRNRINYKYNDTDSISSTIGQLNFFRWAIDNNLMDYIINNYNTIETDMNESILIVRKKCVYNNTRKKRQELSLSASRGLNKHHGNIIICFD